MKNKRVEIILILLSVNFLILLFAILNPQIKINSPLSQNGIELKSISFNELIDFSVTAYNEKADSLLNAQLKNSQNQTDNSNYGSLKKAEYLDNPIVEDEAPLDKFFEALIKESSSQLVRIAHYGDSQIEGDRITSDLRELFQKKFGGNGAGFIPLIDITNNVSSYVYATPNWERHSVFNNRIRGSRYGIGGLVFRFSKYGKIEIKPKKKNGDSIDVKIDTEIENNETEEIIPETPVVPDPIVPDTTNSLLASKYLNNKKGSVKVLQAGFMNTTLQDEPDEPEKNGKKDSIQYQTVYMPIASLTIGMQKFGSFSRITLLYGDAPENFDINVIGSNNKNLYSKTVPESKGLKLLNIGLNGYSPKLKFEFEGGKSPDIYGIYFDSTAGVQIDNYGIRGHSGDGLRLIDPSFLASQYKLLNTKLIILQFGMNVTPILKSDKAVEKMEEMYFEVFKHIRQAAPDASVLVIGVGDMGKIINGSYQSNPYIPKLNAVIKKTAIANGCAYWELFDMMGGVNSIINWSNNGFAARDGHIREKGQKLVANELFKSLMTEFNNYKIRKGL